MNDLLGEKIGCQGKPTLGTYGSVSKLLETLGMVACVVAKCPDDETGVSIKGCLRRGHNFLLYVSYTHK